jgi:hypothetical protein
MRSLPKLDAHANRLPPHGDQDRVRAQAHGLFQVGSILPLESDNIRSGPRKSTGRASLTPCGIRGSPTRHHRPKNRELRGSFYRQRPGCTKEGHRVTCDSSHSYASLEFPHANVQNRQGRSARCRPSGSNSGTKLLAADLWRLFQRIDMLELLLSLVIASVWSWTSPISAQPFLFTFRLHVHTPPGAGVSVPINPVTFTSLEDYVRFLYIIGFTVNTMVQWITPSSFERMHIHQTV